jgi:hypothetical protein
MQVFTDSKLPKNFYDNLDNNCIREIKFVKGSISPLPLSQRWERGRGRGWGEGQFKDIVRTPLGY